jgi:hypothetical protein
MSFGKTYYGMVESPYEIYEYLIKKMKGTFLKWILGKLGVKDLGSNLAKVSLGHERGFKILLDNGAKMFSHKF